MFERKSEALLPLSKFFGRLARSVVVATMIVGIALGIGAIGYHFFARLDCIDSILNASMILTGMGPVAPMTSAAAKIFASAYAIFSGVVFLSAVGIVIAPIFHRVLHHFHMDSEDETPGSDKS